ncbi:hypothetical protein V8B97DRAFT_99356 [Scleroderma yunnanense]
MTLLNGFITYRFIPAAVSTIWTSTNDNWQALESAIRAKGLPLIILIRVSPFPPWVYSNSLFSSIEAVSLTQFVLATLFVLPRVLVLVFIGSRIGSLSDGEQRNQMDTQTKLINSFLIIGGVVISFVVSSILYSFMQKEVAALRSGSSQTDDYDVTILDDAETSTPLLTQHRVDVEVDN